MSPAKPEVEVRQTPPIYVKVAPPEVIVRQHSGPPASPACAGPQAYAPVAPPVAPQVMMPVAPQMAPQPMMPVSPQMAPQPMMPVAPQAAPQAMMPVAPQGLATPMAQVDFQLANQARPGLTWDFIRLPIPIPRLIAIPTTPQVSVPVAVQPLVAQPMMAQPMVAQPMMAQPMMAQPMVAQPVAPAPPVVQQQVFVQPEAPPMVAVQPAVAQQPTHTVVPIRGHAVVPVEGQAVVPIHAAATVPMTASPAVAPQTAVCVPGVAPQRPAAPASPLAMPNFNPESMKSLDPQAVEEFCRQAEALKRACEEARRGTALPPMPPASR